MKRSSLALRLVREKSGRQRKKLLALHPALADTALARELKDYCYRVWTSEPAAARQAANALKTLADLNPADEIKALRSWVEGIADLTRGRLESAIQNLDSASRALSRIDKHESAQPMVAKLIALAMLGRYDAAQRTGEKALEIFGKYNDQLAAGKIEMNLSNIVSRRDQYRVAERYCMSAYRRFKKLGERSWQTMAENGLANTYAELNDFRRAEEFYERALASARAGRMEVTIAEIEASMGNLALFRGMYAEAIRRLEQSRRRYEKLGMPHQTAIAELEIADIYAELNLNSEAAEAYRRLVPRLRSLKMRAEEARARANFGRVLGAADNFSAARRELTRAARLYELEKNPTASASTRLRLAILEMSRGNYAAALKIVDDVSPVLENSDNARLGLSGMWLRGELLARTGRFVEAEKILKLTLRMSKRLEQPAVTQATLNSLGVVSGETGEARDAERYLTAAIESAEAARAPLPGEEFRMAFLAKSLEPFENLTRLLLQRGEVDRAFQTVERARSRSLLEAVTSRTQRRSDADSENLRQELNKLYSRVARADDEDLPKLQKQIRDREKKLAAAAIRADGSARRSVGVRTVDSIGIAAIQKRLGEKRVLVEFVEDAGVYSAFVVTADAIEHIELGVRADEIMSLLEGLHFQFGALRFGSDVARMFAGQLKERADAYLRQMYEKLLGPIEMKLGDRDLIVVPSKALNYVPFHALSDGERYVVESRAVSYAPSAAVWAKLNSRRGRSPARSLLMAYADERIPLVNDEIDALVPIVPKPTKLLGKNSTFSAFQKNAPNADLIHLACHGQFRPDNPMFSSLHLADGWVTVRDVCATRLRASLVTLSACETGLNKIYAGEEILGLARGFLTAGARSLLLSLWTVNDEATARLMSEFYANLQRGHSVSASLTIAQRDFIGRGEHPYYWSPFFVIE